MAAATKKAAVKREAARSSASSRALDLGAVQTFVATKLPGAEARAKFGGASFFVDGKVFAFSRPKGLVLKLPPEVLAELLATREAEHLTMGKRVMRDWVLLRHSSQEAYVDEVTLLLSAMDFVRALEKKKR
jgi:TfoX/Sxy family transcriptional regulator of competence genes